MFAGSALIIYVYMRVCIAQLTMRQFPVTEGLCKGLSKQVCILKIDQNVLVCSYKDSTRSVILMAAVKIAF